jgi:hypothetical protein
MQTCTSPVAIILGEHCLARTARASTAKVVDGPTVLGTHSPFEDIYREKNINNAAHARDTCLNWLPTQIKVEQSHAAIQTTSQQVLSSRMNSIVSPLPALTKEYSHSWCCV